MHCLKSEILRSKGDVLFEFWILRSQGDVLIEISVRRAHEPRGKLNVGDKQETVISSRGMFDERLNNRFIHVGVDTSRYALLIGGRSSYPPCVS